MSEIPDIRTMKKRELRLAIRNLTFERDELAELYDLARCGSIPHDMDLWSEDFEKQWKTANPSLARIQG